jgi:hypothetical protein
MESEFFMIVIPCADERVISVEMGANSDFYAELGMMVGW